MDFLQRLRADPISAKVTVTIHNVHLQEDFSNCRFMVWLRRHGKARGTRLEEQQDQFVYFEEPITMHVTLYRTRHGDFLPKVFEVEVIYTQKGVEAPGQPFGFAEVNLAFSAPNQSFILQDCWDRGNIYFIYAQYNF